MAKKTGSIIAVSAVALLLAGLVLAIISLYKGGETQGPEGSAVPSSLNVLRAVPSDAAAVFLFDGSSKAAKVLADSTGLLSAVITPDNAAVMTYLQALGRRKVAVSLHNSGSLVPLVVTEVSPADSVVLELAAKAGLKTRQKDGFLMASRSETFINAGGRHLEGGMSVLGTRNLQELARQASGAAVLFVSHAHAGKLLQLYASKALRGSVSFVKDLSAWSAWTLQESSDKQLEIKGVALPGEAAGSYFAAFAGYPSQEALFPEVLPYYTASALSVPVPDVDLFLDARRKVEDGAGTLAAFNKALKTKAGRPFSPEEWFRGLQPREVVRASFTGEDGVEREALLVRSAKDLKLGSEASNPYKGCLALLLGADFAVTDTSCAALGARWSVYADLPTVRALQDKSVRDYTLKNRLADASVTLPQGFVAYASLSDRPLTLGQLLSPQLSAPLQRFVTGAGFAPAVASLALDGERPAMRLSVETRALKGTKVQVLERDTTVFIPTGLFPVKNHQSGQTNYLYQNNHLSICLNDENNKGVWGIPFKEPICGRVESIDYYNSKKYQYLFCAGSKLYLLDRLGHWVNGFPVALPKAVLLGPDAYDFTGAGGYTVMILHKDNTLERYNLHGQKPEGWKGIAAPETVKNLPELVETAKGKRYWAVRTSVRTLLYPFEGGEPLYSGEGGRMIKPDAVVTPTSKGVSAECYDGKTRDIKLN
ncbi:MAG: hypothetical protein J6M31_04300 [Bacteroidales bacterium]|nr:hypothetical protein [Bacteroidales bacterium]